MPLQTDNSVEVSATITNRVKATLFLILQGYDVYDNRFDGFVEFFLNFQIYMCFGPCQALTMIESDCIRGLYPLTYWGFGDYIKSQVKALDIRTCNNN